MRARDAHTRRHRLLSGATGIVLLVGCTSPPPSAPDAATPPQMAATPPPCPPAPSLDVSPYLWADSTNAFGDDTAAFAQFRTNFDSAYAKACAQGWLAGKPLVDPAAAHPGTLMLANPPEANTATIYLVTRDDIPADGRDTVLEYPFIDEAKQAQVPSVDILREAIYCRTVGATPEEQAASGRCLPD